MVWQDGSWARTDLFAGALEGDPASDELNLSVTTKGTGDGGLVRVKAVEDRVWDGFSAVGNIDRRQNAMRGGMVVGDIVEIQVEQ